MSRIRRGRLTRREQIEQVNRGFKAWGAAFGKPEVAEKLCTKVPELRTRKPSTPSGRPLEKEIQKTIIEAIELRRDVVFVGRFNRGQAVERSAYGEERYIWFNTVKGFPDIHGLLIGGKAFYLEVKRPPPDYEAPTKDQREFLESAYKAGAYAGVVTSVEEAMAILP